MSKEKVHDYFIPQVNGNKPVEMDIIQGQDVEVENDFMEYLRKAIISGLGVPSSFLQYADEVDFSRSLSMQNSRFLRGVIVMQKSYNETLTALYKKLYSNEFVVEEDETNNGFDLDKISISLPSPANLNMTNLADQLSTVSGVIDFIVQTITGQNAEDGAYVDQIRKIITQKYITNIDWSELDQLIEESALDDIEKKLISSGDNSEDGSDY